MYAIYDTATGEIIATQDMPVVDDGIGAIPAFGVTSASHYLADVDGMHVLTERPLAPAYADGVASLTLDMSGLPAGTVVTAMNNVGDAVSTSNPADPVVLTTAGKYRVHIAPPFPWQETDQIIEVTDA